MLYSLFTSRTSMKRRLYIIVFLLMAALSVSACGKKPGFVDPPVGASASDFPRTYPDVATDKRP